MSETKETKETKSTGEGLKLNGLFAFKMGMSTVYENGIAVPVTALKYEPMVVSQVKTSDKEGYESVQVAFKAKRARRTPKSEKNHLQGTGFENGAYFVREVRQKLPADVQKGQKITIDSIAKGDTVKLTSTSKGHGFTGVVKRYNFAGGPAAHGSGFHRRPGSAGNRTWPARVMPGKRFPGHYGDEQITITNVKVCEVYPDENVILVRGPVPGGNNTLVKLTKIKGKKG